MNSKKHIDQEVEKTLQALDGIETATADAFFFNRLSAKIEHRQAADSTSEKSEDVGFAFSVAAVFLVLILNLILLSQYSYPSADTATNREDVIEELAYEYQVFDLNYYETYEAE